MTRRPNVETFNKREQLNLSKEVKSTREKINEETEKMRDTRAKLFDNRDPGAVFTGFLTAGEPFQEPSPSSIDSYSLLKMDLIFKLGQDQFSTNPESCSLAH